MDTEGTPTQELAALLVDDSWNIVKAYHAFAACDPKEDQFCRQHLHGLNLNFLMLYGFPSETILLSDFERWLDVHPIDCIFANDPKKERLLFPHLPVMDVGLPLWVARVGLPSYKFAQEAKRVSCGIRGAMYGAWAHGAFTSAAHSRITHPTDTDILKIRHGYHCALYDSYMIYLYLKDLNCN